MTPLFIRTVSLRFRLTLALLLAFLLLVLDHRLSVMEPTRAVLNSIISPIQYLAVVPEQLLSRLDQNLQSRKNLRQENETLKLDMLEMQGQMQRYQFLVRENERLRNLLASEAREDSLRMVAEVIAVDSNNFSHQVVVNKGSAHGVFIGQPVLDDQGVVGQVISVGVSTARILLISDQNHALPTRSARSGIRVVVQGIGETSELDVMHVPHSSDLAEGDLLLSSGLGGVFPEGYPVARIVTIDRDDSLPFARVSARPIAHLDRIRMLLLVWQAGGEQQPVFNPIQEYRERLEGAPESEGTNPETEETAGE
ncbi:MULTISPECIES: rod shape-determining protein MreC [Gammaproteobacteria]|uniref:rod shape-determining protein MreC n=1 Tax=Gammaproteobacteria TaxID=1236 RepID=UPI000DCFA9BA|nr:MULTISPECIES: rod shape-determining protein MreC [Gammaproteobacteria]RTE86374.1 rod shape-determining protein MreC [Aliidiomarina sp. B3213]TCZ91722.1 rod shape-determining protein MreC [Lysobacter sp. N42]